MSAMKREYISPSLTVYKATAVTEQMSPTVPSGEIL